MSDFIEESGLRFGPFEMERLWHVEKSPLMGRLSSRGVKMVEFLWARPGERNAPQLWIVEAKTSAPAPGGKEREDFANAILEKASNAVMLWLAVSAGRHGENILPEGMRSLDLANTTIRLVLVVTSHKKEWMPELQDSMRKKLKPLAMVLRARDDDVVVLNAALAAKHGLATPLHP